MFLAAFLLLAPPPIPVLTPSAAQFERVELSVSTPEKPANAFDPNDSTVDARISLPSWRTIRVPAFWHQDYTRSIQNPGATGAGLGGGGPRHPVLSRG